METFCTTKPKRLIILCVACVVMATYTYSPRQRQRVTVTLESTTWHALEFWSRDLFNFIVYQNVMICKFLDSETLCMSTPYFFYWLSSPGPKSPRPNPNLPLTFKHGRGVPQKPQRVWKLQNRPVCLGSVEMSQRMSKTSTAANAERPNSFSPFWISLGLGLWTRPWSQACQYSISF